MTAPATQPQVPASPPPKGRGFLDWLRLFWLGVRTQDKRIAALEAAVKKLQETP